MPDRRDLDQVSLEVPVCAVRACGHCLVVNSKALEILGITAGTPQPDGGRIGMDGEGPDGRFFDNAMDLVYDRMPAPGKEDVKDMILAACRALNSYGVTSSQTDDYCAFRTVPWTVVNEAYRELEAEGKLTVRVYEQSNFASLETLKEFVEAGNKTGCGTDLFRIVSPENAGRRSPGSQDRLFKPSLTPTIPPPAESGVQPGDHGRDDRICQRPGNAGGGSRHRGRLPGPGVKCL